MEACALAGRLACSSSCGAASDSAISYASVAGVSRVSCSTSVLPGFSKSNALRADFGPRRWKLATRRRSLCCKAALTPELKASMNKIVNSHKIVLFMKGTKMFPQCGFSNTVVQILNRLNVPYETVNILEDEGLRQGLKAYSNWPTFPQLYIDGEFFGGCDITLEAFQSGELHEVVEKAMCS